MYEMFYAAVIVQNLFDRCIEACRIAICRVLWFPKICMKVLKLVQNTVVRMVTNMEINGMHSIVGENIRLMEPRFGVELYNVCKVYKQKCENKSDADRLCVQIRELC